jgi:predicted kinase
MTNKRFLILRGCPGSGKSSIAKMLEQSILLSNSGETVSIRSTDDLFLENGVYKFDQTKLGGKHQHNIYLTERDCQAGVDVIIIDNTNIKARDAKSYINLAKKYQYSITLIHVDCGLTESKRRNATRSEDRKIPEHVIERMYGDFQQIKLDEKPFETGYEK